MGPKQAKTTCVPVKITDNRVYLSDSDCQNNWGALEPTPSSGEELPAIPRQDLAAGGAPTQVAVRKEQASEIPAAKKRGRAPSRVLPPRAACKRSRSADVTRITYCDDAEADTINIANSALPTVEEASQPPVELPSVVEPAAPLIEEPVAAVQPPVADEPDNAAAVVDVATVSEAQDGEVPSGSGFGNKSIIPESIELIVIPEPMTEEIELPTPSEPTMVDMRVSSAMGSPATPASLNSPLYPRSRAGGAAAVLEEVKNALDHHKALEEVRPSGQVNVAELAKRAMRGEKLATKVKVHPQEYGSAYGRMKHAYRQLHDAGALVIDDAPGCLVLDGQVTLEKVVSVAKTAEVPDGSTADLLKQFARHAGNIERTRDVYNQVGDVVAIGARNSAICEKFCSNFRLANGDDLRERRFRYMYPLSTSVDQPVVPHTIKLSGISSHKLYADMPKSITDFKQVKKKK